MTDLVQLILLRDQRIRKTDLAFGVGVLLVLEQVVNQIVIGKVGDLQSELFQVGAGVDQRLENEDQPVFAGAEDTGAEIDLGLSVAQRADLVLHGAQIAPVEQRCRCGDLEELIEIGTGFYAMIEFFGDTGAGLDELECAVDDEMKREQRRKLFGGKP